MSSWLERIRTMRLSGPAAAALSFASCGGDGRLFGTSTTTDTPVSLSTPRAFANLSFLSPTAMLEAPGDATRWFVLEQAGVVRVFDNDDTVTSDAVFIDISGRVSSPASGNGTETGLLGMAFHPGFPK